MKGNPYPGKHDGCTVTTDTAVVADAILALTYEQRTANLISFAIRQEHESSPSESYWEDIAERLGVAK